MRSRQVFKSTALEMIKTPADIKDFVRSESGEEITTRRLQLNWPVVRRSNGAFCGSPPTLQKEFQ